MNGDLLKDTAPAQTARSGWTTGRIIALATGSVLALFPLRSRSPRTCVTGKASPVSADYRYEEQQRRGSPD